MRFDRVEPPALMSEPMTSSPSDPLAQRAHHWLSTHAIPLWLEHGFDRRRGCFHEGLHADLGPVSGPVRTMVQARQIYSFRVALDLDLCPMDTAARAITAGARFLVDQCRRADGRGYAHSVDPDRGVARASADLYTQAFVLFGFAQAYALAPMPEYRTRALELLDYLDADRSTAFGGYTEWDPDGAAIHRSNPLMHLLESALAWIEVDPSEPRWTALATRLADLAQTKLIDPETGLIAEEFDHDWAAARESGRFYWEPGHQFEWDWLLGRFETLVGRDLHAARAKLYTLATTDGVRDGRAIDQAWSDLTHRARSARFWPQAERAKAAVQRGDRPAAEESLGALTTYLDVPRPGLWCDVMSEGGAKDARPSKASSLYHIVGAFSEYLLHPPPAAPDPSFPTRREDR